MEDPVRQLREEFALEQAEGLARSAGREGRNRRNATIAGAFVGLIAVAVTAGVTRRALFWHSFLLETCLCGLAGYALARMRGGPFEGLLLFSGAYLAAWLVRAVGLDPSVLFLTGDVGAAAAVQGHFTSLCLALGCGAAVGHVIRHG